MVRIALVSPSSADGLPPEEMERRKVRMDSYFPDDVELERFYNIGDNIFNEGFSVPHATSVFGFTAERIVEAAATRPDVVMVSGGIEPGVDIARPEISGVPVVGTALSTYAVAAYLNLKLGVIVYESGLIDPIMDLARSHRMDHFIVGCKAIDVPISELYPRRPEVRERVVEVAKSLVEEEGADGIFAQGLSMVPASMSASELESQIGVRVLDGEAITAATALMVARLGLVG